VSPTSKLSREAIDKYERMNKQTNKQSTNLTKQKENLQHFQQRRMSFQIKAQLNSCFDLFPHLFFQCLVLLKSHLNE